MIDQIIMAMAPNCGELIKTPMSENIVSVFHNFKTYPERNFINVLDADTKLGRGKSIQPTNTH